MNLFSVRFAVQSQVNWTWNIAHTVRRAKVPPHECPSTTILEPSALIPSFFSRPGNTRRAHSYASRESLTGPSYSVIVGQRR